MCKILADNMAQNSNNPHTVERPKETCDADINLPDRDVNPEGYRLLSEFNNEHLTDNTTRSVTTYGIVQ